MACRARAGVGDAPGTLLDWVKPPRIRTDERVDDVDRDHSFDPDDDLSRISPELALVDPELARRLREREPVAGAAPRPDPAAAAAPGVASVGGGRVASGRREAAGDRARAGRRRRPGTGSPRSRRRAAIPALRPLGPLDVPVRLRCLPFRARSRRRRRALPGPDASRRSRRRPRPRRRLRWRRARPTLQRHPRRARSRSVRRPARRSPWWRRPGVQGFVAGSLLAVLGVAAVMPLSDDGSTISSPQAATPIERAAGGTAGAAPTSESSAPAHHARRPFRGEACHAVREGDDTVREAASGRPRRRPRPALARRKRPRRRRPPRPNRAGLPGRPSTAPPAITWSSSAARIASLLRETVRPTLELGTSWRHEGRVVRLTPGQYRWYVWPVTSGGRAAKAIVQARLAIP